MNLKGFRGEGLNGVLRGLDGWPFKKKNWGPLSKKGKNQSLVRIFFVISIARTDIYIGIPGPGMVISKVITSYFQRSFWR